jgi:hypothetical protein
LVQLLCAAHHQDAVAAGRFDVISTIRSRAFSSVALLHIRKVIVQIGDAGDAFDIDWPLRTGSGFLV